MYIVTAVFFLIVAGSLGMLMRTQLATPNETFLNPFTYGQIVTLHGLLMILWVLHASWGWTSKLHCATSDRRKGPGVSAFKRYKLLDISFQRLTPCWHSVSSRRQRKHRLDTLCASKHYTVLSSSRSNACRVGTGIIRCLSYNVLN